MPGSARRAAARASIEASFGAPAVPVLLGYAVLYCLLDWVSFVQPMRDTGITAWNPNWALAVAMMTRSPRLAWPMAVTILAAAVQPALRHAQFPEMVANSVEVLGDAAIAVAIRRWLGPSTSLATRRAFAVFSLIVALGAALQTMLYAGCLVMLGAAGTAAGAFGLLFNGWVAAMNLIISLPLLFALTDRAGRRELAAMLRTAEWWSICACAVLVSYTVFVRSMGDEFRHFYLLFLPVGWASARFGNAGAVGTTTLVQLLLVLAVHSLPYQPPTVFELHMLLVALGAMGLLVGATVHERHQAEQALRASLRAAAAADMAAALAHELNQPLTSLVSYARATQLLAQRLEHQDGARAEPIVDVTRKLAAEAVRASEVVKRLRDFFRHGGTHLQNTDLAMLIDEVVHAHAARADLAGVMLDWHVAPSLPPLLIDRVQIEVVLRNLVANALDAAAQAGGTAPRVHLDASVKGPNVVVEVHDNGPGVHPGDAKSLFDDRRSSKPGGMGIGLAISRSIVEAHDGRLWAEAGPGGKFFFSLPTSMSHDAHE